MRQVKLLFIIFFIGTFLMGCSNQSKDIEITLYKNSDFVYETINGVAGEDVLLPIKYTSDDTVFVGWKEIYEDGTLGERIYSSLENFSDDIDLLLVEENAEDVFILVDVPAELRFDIYYNTIQQYTGQSQYLRIPNMIDGRPVKGILSDAFQNSNLIEVYIPNTVTELGNHTFQGSTLLKYVEFYGTDVSLVEADFKTEIVSEDELNQILADNATACPIDSTDEDITYYNTNCPVLQSELINSVVIAEETYNTYEIKVDPTKLISKYTQSLGIGTFDGCTSLEEVIMPIGGRIWGFKDAFTNTPNLTNIVFREDHERYSVTDGVVYSNINNDETLEYYLPGNQATEFTIPENIVQVSPQAFNDNSYLEVINIGPNTTDIYYSSFYDLPALTTFNVDDNNTYFKSQDGVLFSKLHGTNPTTYGLFKYPANKPGDTYDLPSSTNFINTYAFLGNLNITTLNLNEDLKFIEMYAFLDTVNITTLDLPAGLEMIRAHALEQSSINTVIVNGSTTSLSLGKLVYNTERLAELNIYVPDEYYDQYLIDWAEHADQLKRMSEYNAN